MACLLSGLGFQLLQLLRQCQVSSDMPCPPGPAGLGRETGELI